MKKPKLLIIVLFQNLKDEAPYYARSPAPPLPGILLAGMTPPCVEVEVVHEMVRPIRYDTDARYVALSFMDYLAPHAFEVAEKFRTLGKTVIGGGKFVSTFPGVAAPYFDSILVGEAQGVWPRMVEDMVAGRLRKRYDAEPAPSLERIPPPRYDLVERKFAVPLVTEASRGCPYTCTYCQLNIQRLPYRKRPIPDVIRDLESTRGLPWYKRKVAMLLDNNLGGDMQYAKDLLREIARLRFWGIGVQCSMECVHDDEFVELLSKARCRMVFLGMESLNEASLDAVGKRQNRVAEYSRTFEKLHERGILTFAGFMFALQEDTPEYYADVSSRLAKTGVCVILPSIAIPIYGTPWHRQVVREGRLVDDDLSHYEGDHVVFEHPHLSPREIHEAYRRVTRTFYSWTSIINRWWRFLRQQSRREPWRRFVPGMLLATLIYFKLSIFQRHHARHRVFPDLSARKGPAERPPRARREAAAGIHWCDRDGYRKGLGVPLSD